MREGGEKICKKIWKPPKKTLHQFLEKDNEGDEIKKTLDDYFYLKKIKKQA